VLLDKEDEREEAIGCRYRDRRDSMSSDVAVASGEVMLAWEVSSRQAKHRAEDCAELFSGVPHVQNNLRVRSTTKTVTVPLGNPPDKVAQPHSFERP